MEIRFTNNIGCRQAFFGVEI